MTVIENPRQAVQSTSTVAQTPTRREMGIPNVKIALVDDRGEEIPLTSNGFFRNNRLQAGVEMDLTVIIEIEKGLPVMAVKIDEDTNEVTQLAPETLPDNRLQFTQKIPILGRANKPAHTGRKANSIRLVAVTNGGKAILWNIGVISQNGHFFLVYQTMCSEQAYMNEGKIEIPGMAGQPKWKHLGELIAEILQTPEILSVISLPTINEYRPEEKTVTDGQVKFYSLRQQKGAIHTKKHGDVRVLWENIKTKRPDGLFYLSDGEVCRYSVRPIDPSRGRTSGFKFDAVDVEVLN